MAAPTHLRAEHLGDAVLGLGEPRPRLSWRLPEGSERQLAYAVELNGADDGSDGLRRLSARHLAGRAAAIAPPGPMAGEGLDRRG